MRGSTALNTFSPMEIAQWLLAREGTGPHWGLVIEDVREGYARVSMRTRPEMLNAFGMVHGGMIFSLADSAFAYACNSRNVATVSLNAAISVVDSGRLDELLTAEATETVVKGRSSIYVVTVFGEDGRIVAQMQGLGRSLGRPILEEESK